MTAEKIMKTLIIVMVIALTILNIKAITLCIKYQPTTMIGVK